MDRVNISFGIGYGLCGQTRIKISEVGAICVLFIIESEELFGNPANTAV